MAKQVSSPVAGVPTTAAIADPAARRAIQSLVDAHNTRNGQTKERFLTEADLKDLAGAIVYAGIRGAGGPGATGPGGTGESFYEGIRREIEDRIFGSELWRKISAEIEWIVPQLSLSLAKIAALADGFTDERAERLEGNERLLSETKAMKVSIDSSMAAIVEEREVRATSDEALATSITTLAGRVGANEAAIVDEQEARVTNDSALVKAINTMWGTVGTNTALIQTGGDIAVNWNAAQASKWDQLQAEVFTADGKSIRTALNQEAQARVDLEGKISNTWTVRMNAGGRFAGFGLGMEGEEGAVQSTFIVAADQFAVVAPGATAGAPSKVPFYIGPTKGLMVNAGMEWSNVTGSLKPEDSATNGATIGTNLTKDTGGVAVSTDFLATWNKMNEHNIASFMETAVIGTAYIGDGAIVNAKIGRAEIDTLNVRGEAITVPRYSAGGKSTSVTINGGADGLKFLAIASFVNGTGENGMCSIYGGSGVNQGITPGGSLTIMCDGYVYPGESRTITASTTLGHAASMLVVMGAKR